MKRIDLITKNIYLPIEDLDFSQSPNLLLDQMIESWNENYGETVFKPFLYLQKIPEKYEVKLEPLIKVLFWSYDHLEQVNFDNLAELEQQLAGLEKTDISWEEFLKDIEILARAFFVVLPLAKIPNAAIDEMPYSAFALLTQVDDDVPDNKTAVWPMELWLDLENNYLKNKFQDFFKKVEGNSDESVAEKILKEASTQKDNEKISKLLQYE